MDARDEVAGTYEDDDADEQRAYVEQQYQREAELHGGLADVVGLRVEGDDACGLLQQHDAQSQDVAPEQSTADDED